MKIKDQVIKCKSRKHGKRIIKYFQSLGVNTHGYKGIDIDGESDFIYYGIVDGVWGNYSLSTILLNDTPIITLPVRFNPKWGDLVEVSNSESDWQTRIFLAEKNGEYIAVHAFTENSFKEGGSFNIFLWNNIRPIQTEKEIPEYTMEELTKRLGHEFKVKK